ncbi:DUF3846 domain-containing protein [Butyricicoccus sp. Marseille-Q5471]|uniref:DUF3846 domain-containing protein n=1 Tax=Butyricicoccus sp. Marseille-Q5471 TaxID=3039493 RepID=UPI0024BD4C94|nr:DUF3846 domain-containing protein [Butyricicoccus sp. Marseille-Q5471]
MKILLLEPHMAPQQVEIGDGLAEMQAVVGGPIEAVYPFDESVALICHEEGKLLNLPLNRALRYPETGEIYDIIAGTCFLCAAPPDSEQFESLSEEQLARYTKLFERPEEFLNLDGQLICVLN